MNNETPIDSRIFIASIALPVNLIMVRSAVACASQVSDVLSFNEIEKLNLEMAVEEAFCNAVQHFSRVANDDERIHVEFSINEGLLIISIRENGIPFNLKQAKTYTPSSIDGMNAPGLGMLLMQKGMDSVELFVHGRDGKETRLTKKVKFGSIPEELIPTTSRRPGQIRPLVKNAIIRMSTEEDLQEICRLAWRCYGYTQEELLYDLELLTKKFLSGELKSVVAFDPASGNMVAHVGYKYNGPKDKVPELGLAFIDPAYKCPKLSAEMAEFSSNIPYNNGDLGMFDSSVTTHIYSQKVSQENFATRPCSLLIGIVASGMQTKVLATTKQEKGTVVNHYKAFDFSPKTVYALARHKDMITEIYNWIEIPRNFSEPDMDIPTGESSVSIFPLADELNVVFIIVHKIGEETFNNIVNGMQESRRDRRDAVYVFLPLGVASSPYIVEKCEKLGLSFAGIMPHIHDGDDRILLQCVNIPIDEKKIRVYGKKTTELFSYIINEQNRINIL